LWLPDLGWDDKFSFFCSSCNTPSIFWNLHNKVYKVQGASYSTNTPPTIVYFQDFYTMTWHFLTRGHSVSTTLGRDVGWSLVNVVSTHCILVHIRNQDGYHNRTFSIEHYRKMMFWFYIKLWCPSMNGFPLKKYSWKSKIQDVNNRRNRLMLNHMSKWEMIVRFVHIKRIDDYFKIIHVENILRGKHLQH